MLQFFDELIAQKAVQRGIEVLTDLKNFFESTPDFI